MCCVSLLITASITWGRVLCTDWYTLAKHPWWLTNTGYEALLSSVLVEEPAGIRGSAGERGGGGRQTQPFHLQSPKSAPTVRVGLAQLAPCSKAGNHRANLHPQQNRASTRPKRSKVSERISLFIVFDYNSQPSKPRHSTLPVKTPKMCKLQETGEG